LTEVSNPYARLVQSETSQFMSRTTLRLALRFLRLRKRHLRKELMRRTRHLVSYSPVRPDTTPTSLAGGWQGVVGCR
jgi:hypothetical protein